MVQLTASKGKLFHRQIELGKNEHLKWFVRAKGILNWYDTVWLHKSGQGGPFPTEDNVYLFGCNWQDAHTVITSNKTKMHVEPCSNIL